MYSVLIRPVKEADAEISWKWRNDSTIWQYTGSRPDKEITLEIERSWIQKAINEKSSKRFAILVDGIYVGNIQLTNITEDTAQYHIFIGEKEYWGKGIAKLATKQILHYAKNELDLESVYLSVHADNLAAVKAYKNTGFVKSGTDDDHIKMEINLVESLPSPMVSVFMLVYNHERYIREALESILHQKVDFDFKLVVGEDCSTDNSREIINEYANLYPGKFKLLLHPHNIGAQKNQEKVLNACNGKYIALCEGDDYWIDPLKLQKQVDFLEVNDDYTLSYHSCYNQYLQEGFFTRRKLPVKKDTLTLTDLIVNVNMPTASMVYRNIELNFPDWFHKVASGDIALSVFLWNKGKIKFFEERMSVYRITGKGISTTHKGSRMVHMRAYLFVHLNEYLEYKYEKEIYKGLFEIYKKYIGVMPQSIFSILQNRILLRFKRLIPVKKEKSLVSICLIILSKEILIQQLEVLKQIQSAAFEAIIAMDLQKIDKMHLEKIERDYSFRIKFIEIDEKRIILENSFLKHAGGNYIKIIENDYVIKSTILDEFE